MKFSEFVHAKPDGDAWRFTVGRELHGAFGGAFGGVVAALCVFTARELCPDREPSALDCRFVHALGAGDAVARGTIVHSGRSMSCVSIDVLDERDRVATRATVSLVSPAALDPRTSPAASGDPPVLKPYDQGALWRNPPGVEAPIIDTLEPRTVGIGERGVATAIRLPWDEAASAEGACVAADLCVGPPVAAGLEGRWVPHPNPDLSLRFCGRVWQEVVGIGRLERIESGVAAVRVEVWSRSLLAAAGVSSSLLLAG